MRRYVVWIALLCASCRPNQTARTGVNGDANAPAHREVSTDATRPRPITAHESMTRLLDGLRIAPARIRNRLPGAGLRAFQHTASIQAARFPDGYFLEAEPTQRGVALTFDDGPDEVMTPRLMRILKKANVVATFFVVGERARRHPDLLRALSQAGHSVAGHGYQHVDLRTLTPQRAYREQLRATQDVLSSALGYRPSFFRPPYGAVTDAQVEYFAERGLRSINWSVDSLDWTKGKPSSRQIADTVLEYAHDGAIILLHSGRSRGRSADALPLIIAGLKSRGFAFRTVWDLLGFNKHQRSR